MGRVYETQLLYWQAQKQVAPSCDVIGVRRILYLRMFALYVDGVLRTPHTVETTKAKGK